MAGGRTTARNSDVRESERTGEATDTKRGADGSDAQLNGPNTHTAKPRGPRPHDTEPHDTEPHDTKPHDTGQQAKLDAVRKLERDLQRRGLRRWLTRGIWLVVLGALAFAGLWWRRANEPPPEPRFLTKPIEVRDIVEKVESTGRLKPLREVQVGAQVSGRVVEVHVDFNSRVKRGDLLAEIDPQLFGAQVGQVGGQLAAAQANLERAKSQVSATNTELERLKALVAEGIATQAELDQAKSAADVAQSDVAAASATIDGLRSQLRSARTTLAYTKIYSPIDGLVIHREVEPGQTVAASFAAPVLFIIAEDLSKMQVLADIDEADVGKVAEGMSAKVTVDAFMGEAFEGRVTQIRYSPTEVQGVVTYSAVVDVDNPELKLRPGMTATVAIVTREESQVLAAPNAALRFKPEDKERDFSPLEHGQARVYQVSGGAVGQEELDSSVVEVGITDGVYSKVQAEGLAVGVQLVTEQTDKQKDKRRFMGLF